MQNLTTERLTFVRRGTKHFHLACYLAHRDEYRAQWSYFIDIDPGERDGPFTCIHCGQPI